MGFQTHVARLWKGCLTCTRHAMHIRATRQCPVQWNLAQYTSLSPRSEWKQSRLIATTFPCTFSLILIRKAENVKHRIVSVTLGLLGLRVCGLDSGYGLHCLSYLSAVEGQVLGRRPAFLGARRFRTEKGIFQYRGKRVLWQWPRCHAHCGDFVVCGIMLWLGHREDMLPHVTCLFMASHCPLIRTDRRQNPQLLRVSPPAACKNVCRNFITVERDAVWTAWIPNFASAPNGPK